MSKTNELYSSLSERAMNMFGNYLPTSFIDSDFYQSPYRDIDITFLKNWIPVVMRLTYHSDGSYMTWIPCLLRKAPDIKREPRGYMEFNGITSLSSQYVEDLEFAISSCYLTKLMYHNAIDSVICGPNGFSEERPRTYNNEFDKWKTEVRHVDVEIYPYFFEYKDYFDPKIINWTKEEERIGIDRENYAILKNKGLPCIKLNNIILGEKLYKVPIDVGYNSNSIVNFMSAKVLDSHYEITYDIKDKTKEKEETKKYKEIDEFFVGGNKDGHITISANNVNDLISNSIITTSNSHNISNIINQEENIEENDEMLI